MVVTDNDILNKHPEFFPEKFYKNIIGENLASDFFNLGLELDFESSLLDGWRKDLQSGVVGNAQELTVRVLFKWRKRPKAKLRDLYEAVRKSQGRLSDDMLVAARKYINETDLEGDVTVEDASDGEVRTLPAVPRESEARDAEEVVYSRQEPQATPQLVEAPSASQSAASSVPPVAVVNPMETNHHSNGEASMEVAMDTDDAVAGEASRPELFRLASDQDPNESLEALL